MGGSDDEMRDAVADEGAKAQAEDQPMDADSDTDDEDRRLSGPTATRSHRPTAASPRANEARGGTTKKEKVRIASSRTSRIGDFIERATGRSRGVARAPPAPTHLIVTALLT